MTQRPTPAPGGWQATPEELAAALEATTEGLATTFEARTDAAIEDAVATHLPGLRGICAALRTMALRAETDTADALAERQEELESIALLLGQTIRELAEGNHRAGGKLNVQLQQLDTIAESPADEGAFERLRNVAACLHDASREMGDKLQTASADIDSAGGRISDLERKLEEARHQAMYDALTKVHSRAALEERLRAAVEAPDGDWCFLIADVDHFKRVNDRYGHVTGDAVLFKVSRAIEDSLAKCAEDWFVGRYGGEEFGIVLTAAALENAGQIGENVRTGVADSRWQLRNHAQTILQVTISIGVAQWHSGEPIEALVQRADEALYRAKREGRNRIALAAPCSAAPQC